MNLSFSTGRDARIFKRIWWLNLHRSTSLHKSCPTATGKSLSRKPASLGQELAATQAFHRKNFLRSEIFHPRIGNAQLHKADTFINEVALNIVASSDVQKLKIDFEGVSQLSLCIKTASHENTTNYALEAPSYARIYDINAGRSNYAV